MVGVFCAEIMACLAAAAKPAAPKVDVVALELTAGLRLQGDTTSDVEKRQQVTHSN